MNPSPGVGLSRDQIHDPSLHGVGLSRTRNRKTENLWCKAV